MTTIFEVFVKIGNLIGNFITTNPVTKFFVNMASDVWNVIVSHPMTARVTSELISVFDFIRSRPIIIKINDVIGDILLSVKSTALNVYNAVTTQSVMDTARQVFRVSVLICSIIVIVGGVAGVISLIYYSTNRKNKTAN